MRERERGERGGERESINVRQIITTMEKRFLRTKKNFGPFIVIQFYAVHFQPIL